MNKSLLRVLGGQNSNQIPIWLMRQAGRYLPEYQEVRSKFVNFLDFCFHPDAASVVTLQPLERFDLDAAIIFSDILVIPHALGVSVNFIKGEGPVLDPITSDKQIKNLELKKIGDLEKVFSTVKIVSNEMKIKYANKALIGFAGSPWTLACYMLHGSGNQKFERAIYFAKENPKLLDLLIDKLVEATIFYLKGQIKAGVEVIKLFDSWAGLLNQEEFKRWVVEPTKKIVVSLKRDFQDIPVIGFPRKVGKLSSDYAKYTGIDCLAIDEEQNIAWIIENLGGKAVQGNLNNVLLATSKKAIKQEVEKILRITSGYPHIFNLGHGVLPETPIENIHELIHSVRNFKYEG